MEYVPYYCEENIWRRLLVPAPAARWAILIFGRNASFAMLRQRAGRSGDGLVFWDYHAVSLERGGDGLSLIFDYDTELPFGMGAAAYLEASFGPLGGADPYAPLFRVLDGEEYARRLYSDRSHMRAEDGSWLSPPPPWPLPGAGVAAADRWPLARLIDPRREFPGKLFDLRSLKAFIGQIGSNRSLP